MNRLFPKILQAGLLVGTLDILSAFIYYFIKTGETKFYNVLKFVASGVFGKDAFAGGSMMILSGLLFIMLSLLRLPFFSFGCFQESMAYQKIKC